MVYLVTVVIKKGEVEFLKFPQVEVDAEDRWNAVKGALVSLGSVGTEVAKSVPMGDLFKWSKVIKKDRNMIREIKVERLE